MKRLLILIAILAVVLLGATTAISILALSRVQAATVQPTVAAPQAPTRATLLAAINAERTKVGVAPLIEDTRLDTSAQRKADDMWTYNYFGHISPHDGEHGYQYINDVGISCRTDSENLAWETDKSQITTTNAVAWWMHSIPHRTALLDPKYTLTGFGITKDAVTEHFCQP